MKRLPLLLLLAAISIHPASAQPADISATEHLGALRLHLSEADAKKAVTCPMCRWNH